MVVIYMYSVYKENGVLSQFIHPCHCDCDDVPTV